MSTTAILVASWRNRALSTLKIPTAKVFEPLLAPARYKAAFGGRGSGKSHFFGELLVETCQAERGTLAVCIREAQRTLAQSSKRLIENKIASLGLGHGFKLYSDKIETPGDGLIIFRGMQSDTTDNVVSANNFIRAGYRLFQPHSPWGWTNTLYWRKVLSPAPRSDR
jgi:phage terminase large subunit